MKVARLLYGTVRFILAVLGRVLQKISCTLFTPYNTFGESLENGTVCFVKSTFRFVNGRVCFLHGTVRFRGAVAHFRDCIQKYDIKGKEF